MSDAGDALGFIICLGGLNPLCWMGCSSDREPPPITFSGYDSGLPDAAVGDGIASDVVTHGDADAAVGDSDDNATVDADIASSDAGPDDDDGGVTDIAGSDAVPPDAFVSDAGAELDAGALDEGSIDAASGDIGTDAVSTDTGVADSGQPPPIVMYQCTFTSQDIYGFKNAGYVESQLPVVVSPPTLGFTGIMRFAAAAGTPPSLVTERLTDPAVLWPHAGQSISPFADELVARYWMGAAIAGNSGTMTFAGIDADGVNQQSLILPMTWADDITELPQPIAFDTSNESYPAFQNPLQFSVACIAAGADPCATIKGKIDTGDPAWQPIVNEPDINRIDIECTKSVQ